MSDKTAYAVAASLMNFDGSVCGSRSLFGDTAVHHRDILEQALLRPRRRSLAEVLAAMPDAGEDADFERRQIDRRS